MDICNNLNVLQEMINGEESFALYFSDGVCGVAESLYPKLDFLFKDSFQLIPLKSVIGPMNPEIQGFFQVFTSPCLLVFIDGKETIRKAGHFGLQDLTMDLQRIYNIRFI